VADRGDERRFGAVGGFGLRFGQRQIGRLGADPEIKTVAGGQSVARLSIATSENWTDREGQKQERMLDDYIRSHEKSFVDQGKPYIYVSLRLVCLGSGFGFGELALMKDIVRMASVRTTCTTTLATMSKKDFG
jgi:hypothetical protein